MTYTKRTYFTMSEAGIYLDNIIPQTAVESKLSDLLENRYKYNWVVFTDTIVHNYDEDIEATPDTEKVKQWTNRCRYIFDTTKDKYVKLINLYKSEENNLLNKIGSETINKFNNTPQNLGLGDTDEYTSTISKSQTQVDPGEIISRLENIRKNYKLIYDLWVKEFDDLFGENTLI